MLRWRDWPGMATYLLSFFSVLSLVSFGQWTQSASPGPLFRPFSPLPQLSKGSASIVPQPTPSFSGSSLMGQWMVSIVAPQQSYFLDRAQWAIPSATALRASTLVPRPNWLRFILAARRRRP